MGGFNGGGFQSPMGGMMPSSGCKGGMSGGAGKGGPKGHEAELQGFIQYWGLDHEVYQAISNLPLQVQIETMKKFSPKPGTRDIKRLFMGFLKSMSDPMLSGDQGAGGKGSDPVATWRPLDGRPTSGFGGGMKRPMGGPSGPVGGSDVFAFIDH